MSPHHFAAAVVGAALALWTPSAFSQKSENKSGVSGGDRNLMMKAAQAGGAAKTDK